MTREIPQRDYVYILGMAQRRGDASDMELSDDGLSASWNVTGARLTSTLDIQTSTWKFYAEVR